MKERLDVLLVSRGLAPSREKAKTMIMEGNVFVNNNREDKAGSTFPDDCKIEIHGNTLKYAQPWRIKVRESHDTFWNYIGRKSLYGYRRIDRWLY